MECNRSMTCRTKPVTSVTYRSIFGKKRENIIETECKGSNSNSSKDGFITLYQISGQFVINEKRGKSNLLISVGEPAV